jgi:hypothetical protein
MIFYSAVRHRSTGIGRCASDFGPEFHRRAPMSARREFSAASFVCPSCGKQCKSTGGLKRHRDAVHIKLPVINPPIPHPNGADDPFDTPPQSLTRIFQPNLLYR